MERVRGGGAVVLGRRCGGTRSISRWRTRRAPAGGAVRAAVGPRAGIAACAGVFGSGRCSGGRAGAGAGRGVRAAGSRRSCARVGAATGRSACDRCATRRSSRPGRRLAFSAAYAGLVASLRQSAHDPAGRDRYASGARASRCSRCSRAATGWVAWSPIVGLALLGLLLALRRVTGADAGGDGCGVHRGGVHPRQRARLVGRVGVRGAATSVAA